ncbi:hypothetical protein JK202_08660 [Gluconobacter sp. Dm-62]|uniref:hypothetical protein n=1 Tax=Gluconobacter sp. Dm-62 TaxID=2799804 RepID=UPI001B8B3562|nr:hypothetical protein [Gluconobacter sp. Dm-62]MBS1103090.1 hypothetical protein [Gluconobacter sp. Dm-62]
MRLSSALALLFVGIWGGAAHAASTPAEKARLLWSGPQGRVEGRACQAPAGRPQSFCIVWTGKGAPVSENIEGAPGSIATLWRRTSLKPELEAAPDLLFYAASGGSGLCGDYVALQFAQLPHFQKIHDCRQPEYPPQAAPATGPFGFSLAIPVMMPFGASDADSVSTPVPVIWRKGTFALDAARAKQGSLSVVSQAFKGASIGNETGAFMWEVRRHLPGQGLPTTTQIMLDLIFRGHADLAQALVHNSTNSHFDASLYWSDLCAILVADPNWKILMHGVLPGAAQVEAAAQTGKRLRERAAYVRGF